MGSATAFLLQEAALLHRQGAYAEATSRYHQILRSEPANADALYHLAVLACQQGRLQEGVEFARRALLTDPRRARAHNLLGMALSSQGQPEEALPSFDQAIALQPDFADAHGNRANALSDLGRHEEALASYEQAVTLNPASIGDWLNRGTALHRLGRHDEALASYDRVLALASNFPQAHFNRGNVLAHVDRDGEALASYDRALALDPRHLEALVNRGNVLLKLGHAADALAGFEAAIAINPDHVGALVNRGTAQSRLERFPEAMASFRQALAIAPNQAAALTGLARAMMAQGDMAGALPLIVRALDLAETDEAKALFVECVRERRFKSEVAGVRPLLLRALSEPWGQPAGLAVPAASLVKLDPIIADCCQRAAQAWPERQSAERLLGTTGWTAIVEDPLLRALLENAPVCDIELERLLTGVRRLVLERAAANTVDDNLLAFGSALARQCFINEYVFDCTAEETEQVVRLREQLMAAAESDAPVPAAWLVAVAAYAPLPAFDDAADKLLQGAWPSPVAALLAQQLTEPREERSCRAAVARLTPISNAVSRKVKGQYEENPYPRWVRVAPAGKALSIRDYFGDWYRPDGRARTDMLVAGCGTGQNLIEMARQLQGAEVLAVDLSLASMGYALRLARAAGLGNITFAEADILELGSLDRRFDVIDASGVLHHLADPWEGWRVLLSLLRPGGFMRVGLYSGLARRNINAARAFVAAGGYSASAEDIRRSRQDLLALPDGAPEKQVTHYADFFTVSECRDVLFHVQEHQMSLPEIADFLAGCGAEFLAFILDDYVLQQFKAQFPQENAVTDLALWHRFETENPDTFTGMYQFWMRQNG